MSSDDLITQIEQRLRREADELLESYGDLPTPAAVLRACRRRKKKRAVLLAASFAGASLAVAFVLLASRLWSPGAAVPGTALPAGAGSGEVDGTLNGTASKQDVNMEPLHSEEALGALPVLLVEWDEGGELVVTPGYCVVEPPETLTFDDLTPGERYAVQQVLGTAESDLFSESL